MDTITSIVQTLGRIIAASWKMGRAEKEGRRKAIRSVHRVHTETRIYLKRLGHSRRPNPAKEDDLARDWTAAADEIEPFSKELCRLCWKMVELFATLHVDEETLQKAVSEVGDKMHGTQIVRSRNGSYTFRFNWITLDMDAVPRADPGLCLRLRADKGVDINAIRGIDPRASLLCGRDSVKKTVSTRHRPKFVSGLWSKDDVKQLRKLFPNTRTVELACMLGRPTGALQKKASRMGLRKSRRYMKSLGRI